MVRAIAAIARNTLLETVRQPVYGLVLLLTCFLIAVSPAFAAHIYTFSPGSGLVRPAERLVADLGLATTLLGGLLLAVFCSVNVVHREIEARTALTVITKRVGRSAFVVGKYLGLAGGIGLATLAGVATVLLTVRMGAAVSVGDPIDWAVLAGLVAAPLLAAGIATLRNYYRGRAWIGSFTLSFVALLAVVFLLFVLLDRDYGLIFLPPTGTDAGDSRLRSYDWDVARAGLLTVKAVWVLAGVAVAASTRLPAGPTFGVCALAFAGGLTSHFVLARAELAGGFLHPLARLWSALVPDLQAFWMSDALTREVPIPWETVGLGGLSAFAYIAAMLFLAAYLFQRREIA